MNRLAGLMMLSSSVLASDVFAGEQQDASNCKTGAVCRKLEASNWSLEAGSGVLIGNVRDSYLDSYTLVPAIVTASYQFDHVYLQDFWGGKLRGKIEPLFSGYYMRVLNSGSEHYIAGFHIGGRYNFEKTVIGVIPFFGCTVGGADADAHQFYAKGDAHGLGQDFNFNFAVIAGFRYDISERFFIRLYGEYTHYSNAGLSEPTHRNKAIDNAGPILSFGMHF